MSIRELITRSAIVYKRPWRTQKRITRRTPKNALYAVRARIMHPDTASLNPVVQWLDGKLPRCRWCLRRGLASRMPQKFHEHCLCHKSELYKKAAGDFNLMIQTICGDLQAQANVFAEKIMIARESE